MITGLFALAILTMKLFPTIPAGRWLHLHLVEIPLQLMSRVQSKHVVFILIGLLAWQAFAVAAPIDLALLAAWDVAVYVDVVAWVGAISVMARIRTAWTVLKARIAYLSPRSYHRRQSARKRASRGRPIRPAANDGDEDEEPRVLLAA